MLKFVSRIMSSENKPEAVAKQLSAPQAVIEYHAPHWVILIRNPGQPQFIPLRDTQKKVKKYNEYGDVILEYPAIRTFTSLELAESHLSESLKTANRVNRTASMARQVQKLPPVNAVSLYVAQEA